MMMIMMMMMTVYLDFEIQQVTVNLVVNVGVILLLAQVQPWDVHRGLKQRIECRFSYNTKIVFPLSIKNATLCSS